MEEVSKLYEARKAYVTSGRQTKYIKEDAVEARAPDSVAIRNLIALALRLDFIQESISIATSIADFAEIVTPDRILPDALADLNKTGKISCTQAYRLLWQQSVDFLLQRSSVPVSEPVDWAIDAADIQHTNEFASELRAFCENPDAKSIQFKVNRQRRMFLRQLINDLNLDIDYVTERKGSPYILVCTKNRDGHERRLDEYHLDLNRIDLLMRLVPQDETGNAEPKRMQRLKAASRSS